MRTRGIFFFAVIFAVIFSFNLSHGQSQQITNGLNYLATTQNPDGSWGSDTSSTGLITSTASVMETYKALGQASSSNYSSALTWLQPQNLDATDDLSERIHALLVTGTDLNTLLSYIDQLAYAWGGYDDYDVNNLDTSLAIQALKAVNYSDTTIISAALSYLTSTQNADGGWGFYQGDDSNIYMTALVLQTLSQFKGTYNLSSTITNAATYLIAHQNTDGGFGTPESTVYESALAIMALIDSGQGQAQPLQNAINYLIASQLVNGSWTDDPYSTALALRALAMVKPNLTLSPSDITFSNPAPTVGDTITITANIKNTGTAQADNVTVQFYSGDPNAGGILIGETPSLSIAAYGSSQTSINWTIPSAGMGTIYIKLDPTNTLDESSETDNIAFKNLTAATLADLYITAPDITFSPAVLVAGEVVVIAATIRNKGETPAANVTVDIFDGDPAQGGIQLSHTTIASITAGGSSSIQFTGPFAAGAHAIYVVADAANTIHEGDETNNTAMKTVSVQEAAISDLAVSKADITHTPTYPTDGDSITVSAAIRNIGEATATNILVRFYLGDPDADGLQIGSDAIIGSIPRHGVYALTTSWDTTGHAGSNSIYVKIDPLNSITELTKLNNKADHPIQVAAKIGPDLVITSPDITVAPVSPAPGTILTVTAIVRNTGNADASNVDVEFTMGDPNMGGTLMMGRKTIDFIPQGGSAAAQLDWNTGWFAGRREIYVNADPANTTAELNETNNMAHAPVDIQTLQGPDLVVDSIDTSGLVTDTQTLNVSGTVRVVVRNKGNQPADIPFAITAFEDTNNSKTLEPESDSILGTGTLTNALAAGASATIDIAVNGTVLFRDNIIYVMADSGDSVSELNEGNNIDNTGMLCDFRPPVGQFNPVQKWNWTASTYNQTMQTPVVARIVDTNGDGVIDGKDVPAIIFNSFQGGNYMSNGVLRAIRGDNSQEIWTVTNTAYMTAPTAQIAVGDIDNDGLPEIVTLGTGKNLIAFNNDGTLKWSGTYTGAAIYNSIPWGGPAIADIDNDGIPEIIMGRAVFNNDGTLRWAAPAGGKGDNAFGALSFAADINMDGVPEIIAGNTVYLNDGTILWRNTAIGDGFNAVADFDGDGRPEIVLVSSGKVYMLDPGNGGIIWQRALPVYLTWGAGLGGAPTVADLDGDGRPEIGVAGAGYYTVFKADGSTLWQSVIDDSSSNITGSTVFDFDGDGQMELIYNDEWKLRIYRGSDGEVLFETDNSSQTAYEYPLVVDVDNDNKAEIVVVANNYDHGTNRGIRVFEDANDTWVNTRKIWNQYSYHITNINDDATIPRIAGNSWEQYNTFRCNSVPALALGTPDITASFITLDQTNYPASAVISARIGNGGAAGQLSAVDVAYYEGDPQAGGVLLGRTTTNGIMNPGEYQDLSFTWNTPSQSGAAIYVVADPDSKLHECRKDNNNASYGGMADLEILSSDVTIAPSIPKEGQTATITASVYNKGGQSAADFIVSFYNGDPQGGLLIESRAVAALSPGSTAQVTAEWNTLGYLGRTYIYIVTDPDNTIRETNESNNTAIVPVDVTAPLKPDLQLRTSDISLSSQTPEEGDLITVTATLHNVGSSTGPVDVCLYEGDPAAGGTVMACKVLSEIIPFGGRASVSFGVKVTGPVGTHRFYAVADPYGKIDEGDETNNSSSASVIVAKPKLRLSVATDKGAYTDHENVQITVDITNSSTIITPLVEVAIEDGSGHEVVALSTFTPERRAFQGWAYKIPAQLSKGFEMKDAYAETTLDFAGIFSLLGVPSWTMDANSIRVAEVDASGAFIGEKQAKAIFSGTDKARVIWHVDGITAANVARHFIIFFDTLENGGKPVSENTRINRKCDLIGFTDGQGKIYVLKNYGNGTFGPAQLVDALPGATYGFGIVVEDFNKDGFDDIVTGTGSDGKLFYYQNKADGSDTFLPAQMIGAITGNNLHIMDTAGADFDGDGIADFVISGNDYRLSLFRGIGNGSFNQSSITSPAGSNYFRGKTAADFDNDGKMDLAVGTNLGGPLYYYKGNGDGTFAAPVLIANIGSNHYGVTSGDFDGDGLVDIIANNANTGNAYLLKGKGDGTFAAPMAVPSLYSPNYTGFDTCDFNNDGKIDVIAGTYTSKTLDFFPGNGDGTFAPKTNIASTSSGYLVGISTSSSVHGIPAQLGSPEQLPSQIYSLTWNTGTTPAGGYKVHAILTGGQAVLDAYANFTIVPDKTLASKVVADRTAYMANQAVTLTSTITSQSANYTFNNLSATISITKSDGQAIFTETKTIATLLPSQMEELRTYWNTGTNAPGTYPVTIMVKDSTGDVLSSSSGAITISGDIKPSKLLKGNIWVDRQHILQGDPVAISYNVTNAGNMDLPSIDLKVLTVHVVNQNIYDTLPDHTSLLMGQSYDSTQVLQTITYTAKDYLVVLRASIGGIEETLSGTYIRVEGAPSAPSLNGPESGADVQTLTPVLIVNNAADPNDDRLTYDFELYTDSSLTDVVTSSVAVPEGTPTTAWQIPMTLDENATYYWRVRAYDGLLYGDWMAPARFRVNVENDPPTAPVSASPTNNTAVSVLTPVLTVNNASDADSAILTYNFEISLDQGFTQPVSSVVGVFEGAGTTSWQVDIPLQENTYYYWRAQADDWLTTGPWSETASFFVNTTNEAPSAPVIISPSQGSAIASLSTDITASNSLDPDSTGLTYVFEIDAAATFDTPALKTSGSIPEGQSNTLWNVAGLQDNTPYYLRAKASDGQAESPWSDTVSFFVNTANDVPTVPVLANPSDGGAVSVAAPLLAVHNATDADGDALTYDFELYADASLTNLVTGAAGIPASPLEIAWSVPMALTENRTYFWRARAYDGQAYSGWMPLASFFVNTANDAPSAPVLYAPSNGSSLQTLTPTLSVTNAIDPDSDVLTYDFEIYSGTTLVKTIAGVAQNASGITSVTASLSDNTTYTWRARAYDGDRYSGWMDTATFSILMPSTGITVEIEVEPETLNRRSHGNWVSVEIELPRGYKARDVRIDSIRLEGVVPAEPRPYHLGCNHEGDEDDHHEGHGDHDRDGDHNEREFKVKFKRSEVLKVLPDGNKVKVHVTGIVGTTTFEGVDTIRVMK